MAGRSEREKESKRERNGIMGGGLIHVVGRSEREKESKRERMKWVGGLVHDGSKEEKQGMKGRETEKERKEKMGK